MPEAMATAVFTLATGYLGLGGIFAAAFLSRGIGRVDPQARGTPLGFKLVILPGVIVFWPLLAIRWLRGATAPPDECSPHLIANSRRE